MRAQTLAVNPRESSADTWRCVKAIVGASSGNLVEWFDFFIYSYFAIYFAHAFFPQGNTTAQLLNSAGVFAIGFLMRPVGGWFFGRIADRHGRRASMIVSVLMMCGGSLVIACLPTYAQIGATAPVLLLIARCVQGLSVGGEYGTSATYMSEVALAGRRGFFASFQYVTIIAGQIVALLVLIVLQNVLSHDELQLWGWRIPFAVGATAALISVYLRRSLEETAVHLTRKNGAAGTIRELFAHKRAIATVIGFTAGGSLTFYTFSSYMQKYLVNTAGMSAKGASSLMTIALVLYMLMQPIFGALSDRIGRRTSMILFGFLTGLATVPLLYALKTVTNPYAVFGLVLLGLILVSFYTSISGLIKAEMFPIEVRALGVGVSYAIANAIFGGSAEYVALWLKSVGSESLFFWYVTAMCLIAGFVAIRMSDPRKGGFLRDSN